MSERVIAAEKMTDDALKSYHKMMVECSLKVNDFSSLAMAVWSDVLKELDKRGHVNLIDGSYDNIGNALICANF